MKKLKWTLNNKKHIKIKHLEIENGYTKHQSCPNFIWSINLGIKQIIGLKNSHYYPYFLLYFFKKYQKMIFPTKSFTKEFNQTYMHYLTKMLIIILILFSTNFPISYFHFYMTPWSPTNIQLNTIANSVLPLVTPFSRLNQYTRRKRLACEYESENTVTIL